MKYLIDTNVISEPTRKQPSANVVSWLNSVDENQLYLSSLSIGELQKGITKIGGNQQKQQALNHWYEQLQLRFKHRVLTVDCQLAKFWGELSARVTHPTPAIDSLIASTALYHHCTLVTRNTKDFEAYNSFGLAIINPWH